MKNHRTSHAFYQLFSVAIVFNAFFCSYKAN